MAASSTSKTSRTTTNHDEIRKWVEKNGGNPARVKATGRSKNDPGILRIDYPGFTGQDTLLAMNWDEWFEAFDANELAFVYQPSTRFSKLVSRSNARRGTRSGSRTAGRSATAGRRSGAKKSTAKRTAKRASGAGRRGTTAKKRTSTRSSTRSAKRPTNRAAKRSTKGSTKRAASRSKA